MVRSVKDTAVSMLKNAGITINGKKPGDIQVHDERFYKRAIGEGTLGVGESYMDGWWDAEPLDEFFYKVFVVNLKEKITGFRDIYNLAKAKIINTQSKKRSKKVAKEHYDIGNAFYEDMLDKRMQYTCGYWKNTNSLDKAQEQKLDLICRKLQLKRGDKVLELGCGWGGFAKYAAEKYGCSVVAYNISEEQVKYAQEKCKGLPVKIIKSDYRNAKGRFDKIASIGLCEHVGYKNYDQLMKTAFKCLKPHGLFLLHTIGSNWSATNTDAWIEKYIFPNSMLPSLQQIAGAAERLFVTEDMHNIGAHYDKTLMAWYRNFNRNWPKHKKKYGERFYRMWKFYLLSCAALFRAREIQLFQIVYSKKGIPGGYDSIR